jgi:hypothetical protein
METEVSLQLDSNPERVESSSRPFHLRRILILSSNLRLSLLSGLFPSRFPKIRLYAFLMYQMHAHTLPVSPYLMLSPLCPVNSTNYETPHYRVFPLFLSIYLPYIQVFFMAFCSQALKLLSLFHPSKITGKIIVIYGLCLVS